MALDFDGSFAPEYGTPVALNKGLLRLTANNPSAFTFHGTNSYIVGTDTLAVIDPDRKMKRIIRRCLQQLPVALSVISS